MQIAGFLSCDALPSSPSSVVVSVTWMRSSSSHGNLVLKAKKIGQTCASSTSNVESFNSRSVWSKQTSCVMTKHAEEQLCCGLLRSKLSLQKSATVDFFGDS